jgi:NADH-quinone oxidoreductase subunit G
MGSVDTEKKESAKEMVEFNLDGRKVSAPKGENLLDALLELGEDISYFCYHPGLSVAACCRQCLVSLGGRLTPACQQTVQADAEVLSGTCEKVGDARKQMLEFTLANHPLDCVICDKAGECALQRQYMDWDTKPSAVNHQKVNKPKKVDLGPEVVLDAERCILCSRCIRFCEEVAKDPQLTFRQRGDHTEITTAPGKSLDNPYSLNTVDVCPVGALTDKDFRFKMRVWNLFSTVSVCNGCSAGCNADIHHKDGTIYRMVPPKRWDTNLNWMCDYGRRTHKPLTENRASSAEERGQSCDLGTAIEGVADSLSALLQSNRENIGVVLSADATNEDNYLAASFAIDFLEAGHIYMAALPEDTNGDDILRTNDPNANRRGAEACARGKAKKLTELEADLEQGKLKALYVVGDALRLSDKATAALSSLDLFVVQSTGAGLPSNIRSKANYLLPAAGWTEVDGTITNHEGEVGRLRPAMEPPGFARPHWELLNQVGKKMGLKARFSSAQEIFNALAKDVPAFSNATWGAQLLTERLRFGGRRG